MTYPHFQHTSSYIDTERLNFGTWTPLKSQFHDTVSKEVTRDIPGCLNISDDIWCAARHKRNMTRVWRNCLGEQRKKIAFNKAKCEFNKESCLCYGMAFSKERVSPDPQKVEATKAAETPLNAKEMNSFLYTVQYYARFMDKFAPETVVYSARVTQSKSFRACESLKEALSSHTVLAYLALQQSIDRSTRGWLSFGNLGNTGTA